MNVSGSVISLLAITGAITVYVLLPSLSNNRLSLVEQLIDWRYASTSVSVDELSNSSDNPETLLFDVRSPEEYAISHLPTAINVSPELAASDFMLRFGGQLDGKRLVFYCSVGQRSSALADRLRNSEELSKANLAFNLRGGIFRWAAAGLPMVNQQGNTAAIHPYNKLAAKLLPPEVDTLTELRP